MLPLVFTVGALPSVPADTLRLLMVFVLLKLTVNAVMPLTLAAPSVAGAATVVLPPLTVSVRHAAGIGVEHPRCRRRWRWSPRRQRLSCCRWWR